MIIPKIYNGRNKTFVFGTVEAGFGSPGRTQFNQTVPITPWRSGDFSALLPATVIRDPFNGNAPFAGNIIPANRINSGLYERCRMSFWLLPNFGDPNTFFAQNYRELRINTVSHQPTITLRVDHRFNDKAFIYGRFHEGGLEPGQFRVSADSQGTLSPVACAEGFHHRLHSFDPSEPPERIPLGHILRRSSEYLEHQRQTIGRKAGTARSCAGSSRMSAASSKSDSRALRFLRSR